MNYPLLKDELDNDPDAVGYAAMSDQQVADSLNASIAGPTRYVAIKDIQSYVDSHGLRDGIEQAVGSDAAARATSRLFAARYETVDVTLPAIQAVLNGLVASNLITQADADAVTAMGATTTTRAVQVWGIPVTTEDIAYVRSI